MMKILLKKLLVSCMAVVLLILWLPASTLLAQAIIYPSPGSLAPAGEYQVKLNGKEAFVYASPVPAAYCSFDMKGPVEISIKANRDIKWVDIRPAILGIKPIFKDSTITFTISKPVKLSVELNGSIKMPLFIFANPPEINKPLRTDPNVIYFEAGKIHHAGLIAIKSNQTVYIEGGAVVVGAITATDATNIKIMGRGILDGSWNNRFNDSLIKAGLFDQLPQASHKTYRRFIELTNCSHALIEGITLHNNTTWQLVPVGCSNVIVNNLKIVSDQPSDDGIDVVHSKNVTIKKCFIRTKDDCVVLKAYFKKEAAQAVENVLVEGCVFWNALWGNALEIGFELNGVDVKNIRFINCDIIHVEGGAAMSIHNAGPSIVSDILFENIRIEDADQKLFDLAIFRSQYSDDSPPDADEKKRLYLNGAWDGVLAIPAGKRAYYAQFRGQIKNVTFKNIQVTDGLFPYSIFYGFDPAHQVKNVTIKNLQVHGKVINAIKDAKIYRENCQGIIVK